MIVKFITYIIKSEKSGRFYVGHTNNIEDRLHRHNAGSVVATRNMGPWKLVYYETFTSKLEANQRELNIKKRSPVNTSSHLLRKGTGRHVPTKSRDGHCGRAGSIPAPGTIPKP